MSDLCPPCPPCEDDALMAAANVAVLRALDIAGKRLVTRASRGQMMPLPTWTRHTHVEITRHDLDKLLADAWSLLDVALDGAGKVIETLDAYVRELLLAREPHDVRYLRAALTRAGLLAT